MLICFVEADGRELRQALDERPSPLLERLIFRVQNQTRAKQSCIADEWKNSKTVAFLLARIHDGGTEFRHRADTSEIERTDFLIVTGAVGRQHFEVAVIVGAEH